MANPVKVITIESLTEKVMELDLVKEMLYKVQSVNPMSIEEIVLKKYILNQSASKTAELINAEGYRVKSEGREGERKYISNDVTAIIDHSNEKCFLAILAKSLYDFNRGKLVWASIVKVCKTIRFF